MYSAAASCGVQTPRPALGLDDDDDAAVSDDDFSDDDDNDVFGGGWDMRPLLVVMGIEIGTVGLVDVLVSERCADCWLPRLGLGLGLGLILMLLDVSIGVHACLGKDVFALVLVLSALVLGLRTVLLLRLRAGLDEEEDTMSR